MSAKIEERVEEMVRGLLTDSPAVELVDVEYVKERDYYLRVYIDKAGGIDIDDCQSLSGGGSRSGGRYSRRLHAGGFVAGA